MSSIPQIRRTTPDGKTNGGEHGCENLYKVGKFKVEDGNGHEHVR